jgi:hypothetical protein
VRSRALSYGGTSSCGCQHRDSISIAFDEYLSSVLFDGTNIDNLTNKPLSTNTSGIRGVSYDKSRQKWSASIIFAGKTYNLGRFDSLKKAAEARREAEQTLYDPILEKYGREPISEESYQEMLVMALEKQKANKQAE